MEDSPAKVSDCPRLCAAMDRFVAEHCSFESSTVESLVQAEMREAPDVYEAALTPLRHKVFPFNAALKWGFMLSHAVPHLLGDPARLPPSLSFDVVRYHRELLAIYDVAAETHVWAYCEEDGETTDEDDEDDESDEDGEATGGSDEDDEGGEDGGQFEFASADP